MKVDSPLVSGLLVPVTALAVAAGPAIVAPEAPAPAVPLVQVEAIQLAGIGQNIYNAITPIVQTVVGDVSYLINFIPLVGGPTAAQINIGYFQGIQPTVAATVDYAAALLHAPLAFFPITRAYIDTLLGIGYDLVSAELRFLGFNELPPRPTGNQAPSPRVATARAAAAVVPEPVTAEAPPNERPTRIRDEIRSQKKPLVRPSASAKAATSEKDQAGRSVETRRQKSTTGRTRSAI